MRLHIYADGACWGNPGPAAIGAVIKDDQQKDLVEISHYIGKGTNNQAEYKAVITALKSAAKFNADEVILYLDSELVIKQLSGDYRVKNPLLQPLHIELALLLKKFNKFSIKHVGHSGNEEAHTLAKMALKNNARASGSV
ncbi:ribonuclease HI family protein [Chloroflexota bacterium]